MNDGGKRKHGKNERGTDKRPTAKCQSRELLFIIHHSSFIVHHSSFSLTRITQLWYTESTVPASMVEGLAAAARSERSARWLMRAYAVAQFVQSATADSSNTRR